MGSGTATTERHRQVAYRLEFAHPISREPSDEDLFFGSYADPEGELIGQLVHSRHHPESTQGLLIPDETIPLVHVEAALEADHRVTGFDMVVALVYEADETPPAVVVETGDRWDAGGMHIFLFEDDDAAAIGRRES